MKFTYILFWITALPFLVVADEFYEVNKSVGDNGIPYPDHLIPVAPNVLPWQRKYQRRIEDHLFQVHADIAQYVVRPSFGPESCLTIRSEIPKDVEEKFGKFSSIARKKKKYFLTVTRASESLWYSMAENNDEKKTRSVKISRIDREISLEFAGVIQRAWGRMLHNTRYPAAVTAQIYGKDGSTYEFSARVSGVGDLRGETWSPQGGLTAEIVSLGDKILGFASKKEDQEEPLLKLLRDFEAKIPEVEPSPLFIQPPTEGPADPFAPPEALKKTEKKKAELSSKGDNQND